MVLKVGIIDCIKSLLGLNLQVLSRRLQSVSAMAGFRLAAEVKEWIFIRRKDMGCWSK